ncbi:exopolyphosphatase [Flavobacterium sp.]|uniref:Ppx/GppA phosphatase family protein n=1 Tax=Flavobacterium sp. TaxID=239 RepID=UPI003D109D88
MRTKNLFVNLIFVLASVVFFAQNKNLYGGIEIGGKGIKVSVIDVDNIKKGDYEIKAFWTDNVGIAKGISIDGNLAQDDILKATETVTANYLKLKNEFKVPVEQIFTVGSSGVAMAKNTKELIDKVKAAINKDLEFITANDEGKMLLRGLIPAENYPTSMVLDIGGGNTKGGYVDVFNNNTFVFFPVSLNYGSITLTEAINKKTKSNSLSEYNEKAFGFLPELRTQISEMYNSRSKALEKENLYLSGGAVWAFYTLYNGVAKQNFNEFKLEDVIYYDAILKNNFKKFEDLAKTDPEIEKVLKTYSQKHLISGSNILIVALEAIPNINAKKLYFAKQGQIAWLVSYVAEHSNKVKKIW